MGSLGRLMGPLLLSSSLLLGFGIVNTTSNTSSSTRVSHGALGVFMIHDDNDDNDDDGGGGDDDGRDNSASPTMGRESRARAALG